MDNSNDDKIQKKEEIRPEWKESELIKTIDGRILIMLNKAIVDKHFIEAQVLSWASIEQILLPRLIGWIARELKLVLPKETYKLNAQSINFLYLCISHDQELFKKLQECRRHRNEIVHKLALQDSIESINKLAKEYSLSSVMLEQEIEKRFNGEVLIPSINLYSNGWNDAIKKVKEILKS